MEAGALTGVSWEGFSHCKWEVLASLSSQTFLQKASSLVSSLVWSFQGSPPPPCPDIPDQSCMVVLQSSARGGHCQGALYLPQAQATSISSLAPELHTNAAGYCVLWPPSQGPASEERSSH